MGIAMLVVAVLVVAGCVVQSMFIRADARGEFVRAAILKGAASLAFVCVGTAGLAWGAADKTFASLVVLGLVLGMLGDVLHAMRFLNERRRKLYFVAGTLAFWAGHVAYLAAFAPQVSLAPAWVAAGVALAAALLAWVLSRADASVGLKAFGACYFLTFSLVACFAAGAAVESCGPRSIVSCAGMLLFFASDIILVYNSFVGEEDARRRVVELVAYYAGQMLVALALVLGS